MEMRQAVVALGALSQDVRLAAFRLLVAEGPDGLAAGVISERLGVPPSSLTFHLRQLLQAGLVTQRRRSRQMIYAVDHTAMNSLLAFLTENCCGRGDAGVAACEPSVSGATPRTVAA